MAYCQGPYANFVSLPVPARPEIYSARFIDVQTGRYTTDSVTGGFEMMPSTVQRVIILASQAMYNTSVKVNTIENRNRLRLEITKSLRILTEPPSNKIRLDVVSVLSEVPGTAKLEIAFKDLTTNEDEKVQLT